MTEHLENLEIAFTYYKENDISVDFAGDNMFLAIFSKDKKEREYKKWPYPFNYYVFEAPELNDEELKVALKKAPRNGIEMEADVSPIRGSIRSEKYKNPYFLQCAFLRTRMQERS